MRRGRDMDRSGSCALAFCIWVAVLPARAETVPMLKPGLWRMTKTGFVDGRRIVESKCVGEQTEQPILEGNLPGAACGKPIVLRVAAGHTMTMTCRMDELTLSTTATVSGDYARRIRFNFVMDATGPTVLYGQTPRRMRSTVLAVRLGECPSGP